MPSRILPKKRKNAKSPTFEEHLIDIGYQLVIEVFEFQKFLLESKRNKVILNQPPVEKMRQLAQNWLTAVLAKEGK